MSRFTHRRWKLTDPAPHTRAVRKVRAANALGLLPPGYGRPYSDEGAIATFLCLKEIMATANLWLPDYLIAQATRLVATIPAGHRLIIIDGTEVRTGDEGVIVRALHSGKTVSVLPPIPKHRK